MLMGLKESDFAVQVVPDGRVPQPMGLNLKKQAVPAEMTTYTVVFTKSHQLQECHLGPMTGTNSLCLGAFRCWQVRGEQCPCRPWPERGGVARKSCPLCSSQVSGLVQCSRRLDLTYFSPARL